MTTEDTQTPPSAAPAPGLAGLPPFIKSVKRMTGGLGCGPSGGGSGGDGRVNIPTMWEFMEMGSPRLALARARGVPFYPWTVNVTATFSAADPDVKPNVGADTKFSQDMYIHSAIARVTNQNTPTNQFDTMSEFFQNFQNAIKVKLYVTGSPRFDIAPNYVNLSNLFDVQNPKSLGGWVATYNQQLTMDFQTIFTLPDTDIPLEVQCTFRCYGPAGEAYSRMTQDEALECLAKEFGIECTDAYVRTCQR